MKTIVPIQSLPREESLQAVADVLPGSVKATVDELGVPALQKFFDGYRSSSDEALQAA